MILSSLDLTNFRNYESLSLELDEGVHEFVGANAQGKTNLLEAVHVLAHGASFRTSKSRSLIRHDADVAVVRGSVMEDGLRTDLQFRISKGERSASVDETPCRRLSDFIGHLHTIAFTSDDLELVSGAPSVRRSFLDRLSVGLRATHIKIHRNYRKVLKQRNAFLREIAERQGDRGAAAAQLQVWDEQLTSLGAKIMRARSKILKRLGTRAQQEHDELGGEGEVLALDYRPSVPNVDESQFEDPAEIQETFRLALEHRQQREMRRGVTSVGPHRDDVNICLNGRVASEFASRGQTRAVVFALKLAELRLYDDRHDRRPVILVDDVAAELDDRRATRLMETIHTADQTFVTCVDAQRVTAHRPQTVFEVVEGQVRRRDHDS